MTNLTAGKFMCLWSDLNENATYVPVMVKEILENNRVLVETVSSKRDTEIVLSCYLGDMSEKEAVECERFLSKKYK